MPAAAPWLDQFAPAQWSQAAQPNPPVNPALAGQDSGAYTFSTGGGALGGLGAALMNNNSSVDTTLHWKLSGTIILALIVIFGLTAMKFRFVTSANLGIGG